jgi:hypothetical protein
MLFHPKINVSVCFMLLLALLSFTLQDMNLVGLNESI